MSRRPRRLGDLFLILGILTLALALGAVFYRGQTGQQVTVTAPDAVFSLSLAHDTARTVTGRDGLTLTLTVQDRRVCVTKADCPDKLCVHSGWIDRSGQVIACVPAGITVRVEGETEVDAVAR